MIVLIFIFGIPLAAVGLYIGCGVVSDEVVRWWDRRTEVEMPDHTAIASMERELGLVDDASTI